MRSDPQAGRGDRRSSTAENAGAVRAIADSRRSINASVAPTSAVASAASVPPSASTSSSSV
jgi:hypothetical protein